MPSEGATVDRVPLSQPFLGGEEWAYVKECLDTNWVSSAGKFVTRFENELAAYIGARHAVAVVNGTAALHLALVAAGVKAGDEVLVSDLTFIAPVNAISYAGAHPVLVDCGADDWQMDVARVATFLENDCERSDAGTVNRNTGRRVRAVVPVHILGHCVDMAPLTELARQFGLTVVEDATESLGVTYRGGMAGTLGDVGCISFNGNKLITTGGGGMIVTDDAAVADRARHLSTQAKSSALEYEHDDIGFNYRLPNILAAIGCAQLGRIDAHLAEKCRIARRYQDGLGNVAGLAALGPGAGVEPSYWLYTVAVDAERYGMTARELIAALAERNIESRPLWRPIHLNRPYRDATLLGGETAASVYARAVSLPCSVGLPAADQDRVIDAIRGLAAKA